MTWTLAGLQRVCVARERRRERAGLKPGPYKSEEKQFPRFARNDEISRRRGNRRKMPG